MRRVPSIQLLRALRAFDAPYICRPCLQSSTFRQGVFRKARLRSLHTEVVQHEYPAPLRKQLKDEAHARKTGNGAPRRAAKDHDARSERWKLTVGIEIHAELNTAKKLFSPARTSLNDTPNDHVSVFDAAMPGAQPQLQQETLLPALRAAIALACEIQGVSGWDRKHYFHWDQPNGYQITQYYGELRDDYSSISYSW